MTELLSPAGSPEAVIAAVQNGADAVYLGMGEFNARRGAKNFTEEEFQKAVRYCRIRGCKVYVALNTLVGDREMEKAVAQAEEYGHSLERELAFRTVHSMFHLLGYDHVNGGLEAVRMREREETVLTQLGLKRNGSYYLDEE
jgi:hypothetical protein